MNFRKLALTAATLALSACGDYGAPDEVINGVLVYTTPAVPAETFQPLRTYYLDPVMRVREDGKDKPSEPLPSQMAAAIRTEMTAAGYTEVSPATDDSPAANKVGLWVGKGTATADYYYSGGWCDIYYGYYGCYYPPVYAGSYTYGGVVLTMVDLQVAPGVGQQYPPLWIAALYGVAQGYPGSDLSRAISNLPRAFDQSAYLQTSAVAP